MNKIYSLFALLAALSFPFNAPAQESGFYAGGAAGWSMIDDDLINDQKKDRHSVDDSSPGWKLFAGYNLNQYFGVELAYVDLGEATATISAANNNNVGKASEITSTTEGFSFAATGRYPFARQFDVFARIGGFYYSYDINRDTAVNFQTTTVSRMGATTTRVPDVTEIPAASLSADKLSYFFGLGVRYAWNENFSIRAEWERYDFSAFTNQENNRDLEVSINIFSAGFEYHF